MIYKYRQILQRGGKKRFPFHRRHPHPQNEHADGRRHFAEDVRHRFDLRRKLRIGQKERKRNEDRKGCGIQKHFFKAHVLFVARNDKGYERPADKAHGKEVHHRVGGGVCVLRKEGFQKRYAEKAAIRHDGCDGSDAVLYVIEFFAPQEEECEKKQNLRGGDDAEKNPHVAEEF